MKILWNGNLRPGDGLKVSYPRRFVDVVEVYDQITKT